MMSNLKKNKRIRFLLQKMFLLLVNVNLMNFFKNANLFFISIKNIPGDLIGFKS